MGTTNVLVSCAIALATTGATAGEMKQETTVHRFEDMSVIDGAKAELVRMDNGIYMTLDTVELTPGDTVTMWWVVFNEPGNCSEGVCNEDDVLLMDADGTIADSPDGSTPINPEAWEAASISILRADGLVADQEGTASFRGHLPLGDTTEAVGGPGLLDATKAEVHAVIRTHKQVEPGMANEAINSLNGGCAETWPNEPCQDVQFSVFKPQM